MGREELGIFKMQRNLCLVSKRSAEVEEAFDRAPLVFVCREFPSNKSPEDTREERNSDSSEVK